MSKDKNDVVLIDLDRPRELRYGHKALKTLLAMTGKDIDSIDMDNIDLGEIEKYLYCGLLSDAKANGETLKLENMEDLLDQAPSFGHIIEKMNEAFSVAFGGLDPNLNQPEKVPAKV
ncbi:hypothetical protein RE628_11500 [Paenibacillus sp. D2_2]|uniref:hypothetical protein n=1 Tax=Paenibacillus sp. D2_2 TaxID=3073092 RepID=UPI002816395C|nr:hypothetical protein [Paenibacillus sp. D2_2]WMT42850.1 hypothetical protein RE628_11500 [Paenibacillus sp. D2_2]